MDFSFATGAKLAYFVWNKCLGFVWVRATPLWPAFWGPASRVLQGPDLVADEEISILSLYASQAARPLWAGPRLLRRVAFPRALKLAG